MQWCQIHILDATSEEIKLVQKPYIRHNGRYYLCSKRTSNDKMIFEVTNKILFQYILYGLILKVSEDYLQFPSTKWGLAEFRGTAYIAMRKCCRMCSNIHHVPAIQANNDHFGAGVSISYMLTVSNHAVKSIGVDNNLCEYEGIGRRENSPRKHVKSVSGGREKSWNAVVGRSNVCFYRIEHKSMM